MSGMDFYSQLIGWAVRLCEVPLPNNIWHSYMIQTKVEGIK